MYGHHENESFFFHKKYSLMLLVYFNEENKFMT